MSVLLAHHYFPTFHVRFFNSYNLIQLFNRFINSLESPHCYFDDNLCNWKVDGQWQRKEYKVIEKTGISKKPLKLKYFRVLSKLLKQLAVIKKKKERDVHRM